MATLFNKLLTGKSKNETVVKAGGRMRDYLSKKEYEELTENLKLLVEKKREPTTAYDYAFSMAYNAHMEARPFLKTYTDFLMKYPKCSVADLHALCLGYGTAGSVLDSIADEDTEDIVIKNDNNKKKFH
jgi:hypothetical protein